DASAMALPRVVLDNTFVLTNAAAFAFTGLPGKYQIADASGAPAAVSFTVNPNGTVGYDPTLEGVLTGAGTSTLKIRGATVTIDATALSLSRVALDNTFALTNAAAFTFTGLPGKYQRADGSGAPAAVSFTLNASGTVSYDPALEGALTGSGTSTLTVRGATVTIDATALSVPTLVLDNSVAVTNAAPFAFTG